MRHLLQCLLLPAILVAMLPSCMTVAPKVKTVVKAGMGGCDLVYFSFGKGWSAGHTMTEVLQQEFERRQFVVLLEEPAPELWPRTLRLHLDLVEDSWRARKERADHLGRMGFRLQRMADGQEVGWAVYDGAGLDRIGQRDLARAVVNELLKNS